jgi:phosphopantetheinyl transferase
MTIQIATLNETPEELLSQLDKKEWYLPTLSKMSEQRRREWLAVRVLLKKTLGEEKQIGYTELGKPYLIDQSHHISISHTKGFVAIALDNKHPVAVDIERISPRVQKLQSRFMNDTEEKQLSVNQPLIHALLHWSAKETLFKYLDENDIEFKSQLHIHAFEPVVGEWGECTAHETRTEKQQLLTIRYRVGDEYVITALSNTLI